MNIGKRKGGADQLKEPLFTKVITAIILMGIITIMPLVGLNTGGHIQVGISSLKLLIVQNYPAYVWLAALKLQTPLSTALKEPGN